MTLAISFLLARLDEDDAEPFSPYANAARVLADLASKRILASMHAGGHECPSVEDNCGYWIDDTDPCPTICVMAAVYSDHPDYEGWKPDPH